MSREQQQATLELSTEERYEIFLDLVGEEREIWILVNSEQHFLRLHTDEQGGLEYLPVWPTADFAAAYAADDSDLKPKSIALPQFLNKWITGLERDGIEVGVFPGPDGNVWITEPSELEQDLRDELSRF